MDARPPETRPDPFDVKTTEFIAASDHRLTFPDGQVFSGHGFFDYLNAAAKHTYLWVITYTATGKCPLIVPVRRLIVEIGDYPPAVKQRRMHGLHTKLYLQWNKRTLIGAYIGSQNLVAPTSVNLMARTSTKAAGFLLQYFNHLWNLGQ